jgi:thiosulfate/3-mercaptopyruvate sulfurtransferase
MERVMSLPLLIQTEDLVPHLQDDNLLILDTCNTDNYVAGHIPGAIHIAPSGLQSGEKPGVGRIPSMEALSALFSRVGLTPDKHVIAYDDEGGGWAGRLIWTLDAIGHTNYSFLDGGLNDWTAKGFALETQTLSSPSNYPVSELNTEVIAETDDIIAQLGQSDFAIWDARSTAEYTGEKSFAPKAGHIPGAAHLEWTDLMDKENNLRLLPLENIQTMLNDRGLTSDKNIVTHCQSHHRSGLTYLVAKILGYPSIKGYHGSWSEWGNLDHTPFETGNS